MRFEKFLKEDAAQLAIPGMASRTPHVYGDANPDTVSKKCPPDKIWNEAKQRCEKALATKEVRITGSRPSSSRITGRTWKIQRH